MKGIYRLYRFSRFRVPLWGSLGKGYAIRGLHIEAPSLRKFHLGFYSNRLGLEGFGVKGSKCKGFGLSRFRAKGF